jgi:hypothetical protein
LPELTPGPKSGTAQGKDFAEKSWRVAPRSDALALSGAL